MADRTNKCSWSKDYNKDFQWVWFDTIGKNIEYYTQLKSTNNEAWIEEINDIRQLSQNVDGVIGVHDIAVHSYGKDKFASIHIEIDADENQIDTHDISENVEKILHRKLGVAPTVHVDPVSIKDPKTNEVKKSSSHGKIDIKDKKCVRLVKGDFDNKTEYKMSPVEQAGKYKDHGFKNLHIVDLDGALNGETVNLDIIEEIVSKFDLKIEIGGGIRNFESINKYTLIKKWKT